jgi:hypothetical protein
VMMLAILMCHYCLQRRRHKNQEPYLSAPPHAHVNQAVGTVLQQPQTGQITTAQSGSGTSTVQSTKMWQGMYADMQPGIMGNNSMGSQYIPQLGSMQSVPGMGGTLLSGGPTNTLAGDALTASTVRPMRVQSMESMHSSHFTTGGSIERSGGGSQLSNVYQAAFPTRDSNTTFAATAVGSPQPAPGPGASSESIQEHVQYQIDSLGATEVLDGLKLQQGMRSRLLGGVYFLCSLLHKQCLERTLIRPIV